jgi:hypothetical protein
MIGSHSTAEFWIPSQSIPPPASAGGMMRLTLKTSLPPFRAKLRLVRSTSQSSGSLPPGAARISRKSWRASSQVRSPVSRTEIRYLPFRSVMVEMCWSRASFTGRLHSAAPPCANAFGAAQSSAANASRRVVRLIS